MEHRTILKLIYSQPPVAQTVLSHFSLLFKEKKMCLTKNGGGVRNAITTDAWSVQRAATAAPGLSRVLPPVCSICQEAR